MFYKTNFSKTNFRWTVTSSALKQRIHSLSPKANTSRRHSSAQNSPKSMTWTKQNSAKKLQQARRRKAMLCWLWTMATMTMTAQLSLKNNEYCEIKNCDWWTIKGFKKTLSCDENLVIILLSIHFQERERNRCTKKIVIERNFIKSIFSLFGIKWQLIEIRFNENLLMEKSWIMQKKKKAFDWK